MKNKNSFLFDILNSFIMKNSSRKFIFAFATLFLFTNCFSQSQFIRGIGGNDDDVGESIIQTSDSGFAIIGHTESFVAGIGVSIYVIRISNDDSILWTKTIAHPSGIKGYSIVQTSDGGFAICGMKGETFGGDAYIAKLDANGNMVWNKLVGGSDSDGFVSIIESGDGGLVCAGFTSSYGAGESDFYIVKFSATGNILWSRTIGFNEADYAECVIQTSDGGYAISGESEYIGDLDIYLVKLDAAGLPLWGSKIGYTGEDFGNSVIQTSTGAYIVGGVWFDVATLYSYKYFAKFSSTGTALVFNKVSGGGCDRSQVLKTPDGGVLLAGCYDSTSQAVQIVKMDSSLNFSWSKSIGTTYGVSAVSITPVFGGGYALTGRVNVTTGNPDVLFMKTDSALNTCGTSSISPSFAVNSYTGGGGTYSSGAAILGNAGLDSTGGVMTDVCVFCTSAPPAPGTISGNTTICSGSANIYSISPVTGATTYTWSLPSGWTGSSTTTSINTVSSVTGGNISVTANNSCGSSAPQTLVITISGTSPPTPGSINGSIAVCSGSSHTYSISAVTGATSYTWSLPSGWGGASTTTSIGTTASSTSGNISVIANNASCSSPAQTKSVTVSTGTPATPGTISGSTPVCSASLNTYSVSAVTGATSYTWTVPSGWSGSSTTTSINTTASSAGGNITVVASNGCGSSAVQTKAVTVTVIDTSVSVSGFTLTANASGVAYQWLNCGTGNTPVSGATNINFTPASNGSYAVVITKNGCSDTSSCHIIIGIGIRETITSTNEISIHPNPTTGKFTVSGLPLAVERIQIYNTLGEKVYQSAITPDASGQSAIDIQHIQSGVYFCVVSLNGSEKIIHTKTQKLIILK